MPLLERTLVCAPIVCQLSGLTIITARELVSHLLPSPERYVCIYALKTCSKYHITLTGNLFLQINWATSVFDYKANDFTGTEYPLPDIPDAVR